jgi:hypothetical protein
VGRSVRPVIYVYAANPSCLSDCPGGGGGSEVDVRSSVECPISLSVVVALVWMDGVAHVRAVPTDLPAM